MKRNRKEGKQQKQAPNADNMQPGFVLHALIATRDLPHLIDEYMRTRPYDTFTRHVLAPTVTGLNAFSIACKYKRPRMLRRLLQLPDIDMQKALSQQDENGYTPLMLLLLEHDATMLENVQESLTVILPHLPADALTVRAKSGQTVLQIAISEKYPLHVIDMLKRRMTFKCRVVRFLSRCFGHADDLEKNLI